MCSIVNHAHGNFPFKHDPVMEHDLRNGMGGGKYLRRYKDIVVVERHIRHMDHIGDAGAGYEGPSHILFARRGLREIEGRIGENRRSIG